MGSKPMFEWYIWVNNMHDLVKILTEYGLYPIVNERCVTLAPQFSTLYQYNPVDPNSNFHSSKPTWEATWASIKWSERAKRTFSFERLKQSPPELGWFPFFVNYIIHTASDNVSKKTIYKHGTWDPQPNKKNRCPLDNIHMIILAKVKHQFNRIDDLRVKASLMPPL